MDKAREAALKALMETETKEAYSNLVLKKLLRNKDFDARDRAFITELVYGTISRKRTLDWIISQFSKTRINKLSVSVLVILRLGVYQLLFLDKVPPSAACNTSVDLAKRYAKAASGFVNGVLRSISRGKDTIRMPDSGPIERILSIRYSFPEHLIEAWISEFGPDFTKELLASFLERPDFYVRVNTLKTNRNELVRELSEEGISIRNGRFLEEALILQNVSDISRLRAFTEGRMTVQDESSMMVAKVLDPKPGEIVLDVCSAPGGKATHIGQYMKNKGRIICWDIHKHKIRLIKENADRMGIANMEVQLRDALEKSEEMQNCFHRVLVDAPCSGTGIIRRKPDIKWMRKQEDVGKLVEIQRKILYNASKYVAPGGVLVYSTCSLDPRENGEVIKEFLWENTSFRAESLTRFLPEQFEDREDVSKGMLNLYPHIDGTDGFFIARMRKNKR